MLIGIDGNGNIKQIENIADPTLTPIEVNREEVFPGFSDIRILNYRYIPQDNGYSITPAINPSEIERLELVLENTELMYQLLTGEEL